MFYNFLQMAQGAAISRNFQISVTKQLETKEIIREE